MLKNTSISNIVGGAVAESNHENKVIQSVHAPAMIQDAVQSGATLDRSAFNRRQTEVFDRASAFFASEEAVPDDALDRLHKLLSLGLAERDHLPDTRFLDVGAGCGVLTGLLLEVNPGARVTAVDLSKNMLDVLKERFPGVQTVADDVLTLSSPSAYDSIWINACFGNLYDPGAVIRHLAAQLSYGASLHISHPMGRGFQGRLHKKDPLTVPNTLPGSREESDGLFAGSGLDFVRLVDEEQAYLLTYRLNK